MPCEFHFVKIMILWHISQGSIQPTLTNMINYRFTKLLGNVEVITSLWLLEVCFRNENYMSY